MGFGLGFLFDPLRNLNPGGLFGGPQKLLDPEPTAAKPLGLLHAGLEPPPAQGGGLLRAGQERGGFTIPSTGQVISADAPAAGAVPTGLTIDPPAMPGTEPSKIPMPSGAGADAPLGGVPPPSITNPTASPRYTPTEPSAGEAPLRAPYQNPAAGGGAGAGIAAPPPGPGAGPATTGATGTGSGGPVPTRQLGQQSAMGKLAEMGKALGGAGQKAAVSGHAPGGIGGDPAAASRAGAAGLLEAVMKARAPKPVGGVPGLPPGLMQRFRGG